MSGKDLIEWGIGLMFAGIAGFVWIGLIALVHDVFVKKDDAP